MTSITYRDGVMAADSAAGWGNDCRQAGQFRKIARLVDGSLAGISGSLGACELFLRWLDDRGSPRPPLKDSSVLVVSPNGEITQYEEDGDYLVPKAPFVARGSGAPAAYGAMYAGATAEEAVRIAILVDPWSSGEVQIERLDIERKAPSSS